MTIDQTGIEELRQLVRNFGRVNETLVGSLTIKELVRIHRAWLASGWDLEPDTWTYRQLNEAKRGIVPQWDNDMRPIYGHHRTVAP